MAGHASGISKNLYCSINSRDLKIKQKILRMITLQGEKFNNEITILENQQFPFCASILCAFTVVSLIDTWSLYRNALT